MKKKVYMMVTKDELSLPLIVADSVPEMSRLSGASENTISSTITHNEKEGRDVHPRFLKIMLDDEEEGM